MAELTDKQKRFIDEYLVDLNATQAAIRAGYSEKTANRIASENLTKLDIMDEIEKRMKVRENRTEITQDKVVQELAKIAFANGSDFAKVVEKTGLRPKYDKEGNIIDQEEFTYKVVEIANTDEISDDKKATIAGIKETKFGISVETCDKVKALELLGKHLGMFVDKVDLTGNMVVFKGENELED